MRSFTVAFYLQFALNCQLPMSKKFHYAWKTCEFWKSFKIHANFESLSKKHANFESLSNNMRILKVFQNHLRILKVFQRIIANFESLSKYVLISTPLLFLLLKAALFQTFLRIYVFKMQWSFCSWKPLICSNLPKTRDFDFIYLLKHNNWCLFSSYLCFISI